MAEAIAVAVLLAVLAAAVAEQVPELAVAAPAAGLLIALGIVTPHEAWRQISELGPTVGFLAAVLLLAHLCDEEGVFAAAGRVIAARSGGAPTPLLRLVFVLASLTTALLSLDATVVLLTPVVLTTARSLRLSPRPHVHACAHLSNSASLLLPVSNLTNLLAFAATGLSFSRFGALMLLPWLVTIGIEYAVFTRFFATDLRHRPERQVHEPVHTPVVALVILGLTLIGFGVSSLAGIEPVWVATAGAGVLALRRLARRQTTPARVLLETNPAFCLFVLALGVIVSGVGAHGLGEFLGRAVPDGGSLLELLAAAGIAALLANVLNNLPALLLLLAVVDTSRPAILLAILIGVNVGPNLTYTGSLATLLWRRSLARRGVRTSLAGFVRLGAVVVPVAVGAATVALWLGLRLIGSG
ncbi:MAG TPA: SLC13 family permease [Mycobacteriales bacterium]|nr:SLC13 family permease [Mycobacteriales bacterium]